MLHTIFTFFWPSQSDFFALYIFFDEKLNSCFDFTMSGQFHTPNQDSPVIGGVDRKSLMPRKHAYIGSVTFPGTA